MATPKLIILYGFAGVGKTTLAGQYVQAHPLSIRIEGDQIITLIGQWMQHEDEARKLTFKLTIAMVKTCLENGNDVVLPFLPTNSKHITTLRMIAQESHADCFEVLLQTDKATAIRRLFNRGTWGEEGFDPITEKDMPLIENDYNNMIAALDAFSDIPAIPVVEDQHEDTYKRLLAVLKE